MNRFPVVRSRPDRTARAATPPCYQTAGPCRALDATGPQMAAARPDGFVPRYPAHHFRSVERPSSLQVRRCTVSSIIFGLMLSGHLSDSNAQEAGDCPPTEESPDFQRSRDSDTLVAGFGNKSSQPLAVDQCQRPAGPSRISRRIDHVEVGNVWIFPIFSGNRKCAS